jgi:hypothetical protein
MKDNLTGYVLSLLSNDYEFEAFQSYWKIIVNFKAGKIS